MFYASWPSPGSRGRCRSSGARLAGFAGDAAVLDPVVGLLLGRGAFGSPGGDLSRGCFLRTRTPLTAAGQCGSALPGVPAGPSRGGRSQATGRGKPGPRPGRHQATSEDPLWRFRPAGSRSARSLTPATSVCPLHPQSTTARQYGADAAQRRAADVSCSAIQPRGIPPLATDRAARRSRAAARACAEAQRNDPFS